jgi:hypothetical protein
MRQFSIHILILAALLLAVADISHAARPVVEVRSITVVPDVLAPGKEPAVKAVIGRTKTRMSLEPAAFNIIAVVTLPNNIVKSSIWKNVLFERGQSREIDAPAFFDTRLTGTYTIRFYVYSLDMRRRLATSVRTFIVVKGATAGPTPSTKPAPAEKKEQPMHPVAERPIFGLGVYGNALNPAGGGTVILWPFEHVGIQGSYTAGQLTTTEARLLVKFGKIAGVYPYLGAGYISVSKDATVIGVPTEFKDSGMSGVVGAEVPFGRNWYGYIEVSGSAIRLQETVTNGVQTVDAKVSYSPVSICAGIVFYLF